MSMCAASRAACHRWSNPVDLVAMRARPFERAKVFYSGSIRGAPEADPDFAWHIVRFLVRGGAEILTEHVAARSVAEMERIRARKMGRSVQELYADPERWYRIRSLDAGWVDEATHLIALVNSPSHGVGMEIERALLKPERGLGLTPILCLIHGDRLDSLSYMIRGIREPGFYLRTYSGLVDAKRIVREFLTRHPPAPCSDRSPM